MRLENRRAFPKKPEIQALHTPLEVQDILDFLEIEGNMVGLLAACQDSWPHV